MKGKFRQTAFLMIAGLLLISCSFPTWIASEISNLISPYLPTPTYTIQPAPSDTFQPLPTLTSEPTLTPTVEPVPTQTELSLSVQIVDRTYFEESADPKYEIDGVWPNLLGPEDAVSVFNTEIDSLVREINDEFLTIVNESAADPGGSGEAPLSTLTYDYELTYSDESLFSFHLLFDQYIAMSAHPFPFSNSLNYDVQLGQLIQLTDLFLPGVDPIEQLESFIDPVLVDRDFGYTAGTAGEVMNERENWNFLPEGLRINFDVYEVAPYAAGPQYVVIPWGDLAGTLDPDGPAGVFLE